MGQAAAWPPLKPAPVPIPSGRRTAPFDPSIRNTYTARPRAPLMRLTGGGTIMSYAARVLRKGLRRVLWAQISLTFVVAAVAALDAPRPDVLGRVGAALAGGAVAMLGALLLAYSVARADGTGGPASAQLWLYGGAVARFVLAIVFLGLGLGVFHVSPLPFLIAFGLGQAAFLVPGISSGL